MKVSIVILNYNGKNDTLACLDSITKLNRQNFDLDVIVVDNASSDNSVVSIKKAYPQVTVLKNFENLGFAEGNNIGIRFSLKRNADFIFILNNDTVLDKNCIQELLNASEKEKTGGIFGPKIYFSAGNEFHKGRYKSKDLGKVIWFAGGNIDWANVLASHRGVDQVDEHQYDSISKTSFITGCAMFVRKEVFENIGLFDAKLYLYYEDVDFSKKAYKKGFDLFFVPKAIVWHKNAESAGGPGSDLQSYYLTRNRMLIGMRYAPWKTKLALLREALNLLMHGTVTVRQAIGDFLRKKYGKRNTKQKIRLRIPNLLSFIKMRNKKTN